MPMLAQQLDITPPADTETAGAWTKLQRSWSTLVQCLNVLSGTGTTANKPTTPKLDDILYTETDARGRTFVAVSGAWQKIRPGLEVIATASLPAASADLVGLVVIENAGGGTFNLIYYGSSTTRWRVTGASF